MINTTELRKVGFEIRMIGSFPRGIFKVGAPSRRRSRGADLVPLALNADGLLFRMSCCSSVNYFCCWGGAGVLILEIVVLGSKGIGLWAMSTENINK